MGNTECKTFLVLLNMYTVRDIIDGILTRGPGSIEKYVFQHMEECSKHSELESYESLNPCIKFEFMRWVGARMIDLQRTHDNKLEVLLTIDFMKKWVPRQRELLIEQIAHAKSCEEEHHKHLADLEADLAAYDELARLNLNWSRQGNQ